MFQIYMYIKINQGLTDNLIDRCKSSGFTMQCVLTVDTVVAGNQRKRP